MQIKKAGMEDIEIIRHIACLTWPIAYATILSPGQLNYMLNKMYSHQQLQEQMMEANQYFFIAYEDDRPIGFANAGKVDDQIPGSISKHSVWKLHKLYVLPTVQKSGAGKALLQQAHDCIISESGNYMILNVNRSNAAYHYYLKQGFEVLKSGDFDIGKGFFMNDYVMGKALL